MKSMGVKWLLFFAALLFVGNALADGRPVTERKIQSKTALADVSVAYPETRHAVIDSALSTWARQTAHEFRQMAGRDAVGDLRAPYTLNITYEIARNDGVMFSMLFTIDQDLGGAHGIHNFRAWNFLVPDGTQVEIEQILTGRQGLQRLSALTVASLKRQLLGPQGDPSWIARGAGPSYDNFTNVLLLPDALRIEFEPYAVASYAEGAQQVRIPLSSLKGFLRSDLRTPVPSFDCGKASTAVERAICSSLSLAMVDRQVARLYRQLVTDTNPDDASQARAEQRAWLRMRDSECAARRGEALEGCLTRVYQARVAALEQATNPQ